MSIKSVLGSLIFSLLQFNLQELFGKCTGRDGKCGKMWKKCGKMWKDVLVTRFAILLTHTFVRNTKYDLVDVEVNEEEEKK